MADTPKPYRWDDDTFAKARACSDGVWRCLMVALQHRDDPQEEDKWRRQADKLEQKFTTFIAKDFGIPNVHYSTVEEQARAERGIIPNYIDTIDPALFAPPGPKDSG